MFDLPTVLGEVQINDTHAAICGQWRRTRGMCCWLGAWLHRRQSYMQDALLGCPAFQRTRCVASPPVWPRDGPAFAVHPLGMARQWSWNWTVTCRPLPLPPSARALICYKSPWRQLGSFQEVVPAAAPLDCLPGSGAPRYIQPTDLPVMGLASAYGVRIRSINAAPRETMEGRACLLVCISSQWPLPIRQCA